MTDQSGKNLRSFAKPNDPILLKAAEVIEPSHIGSPDIQNMIEEMLDMAYGEQGDRNKGILVGLAGSQVGISKKILLVDVASDGKGKVGDIRIYINPEIVWMSEDTNEWYEGCYSTAGVCGVVSRANKVRVKALDRYGKPLEEEYQGYVARIFQHEIGHLNGKEFIDLITDDNKLHWVEDSEFSEYRDKEAWRNWAKKCSREKWSQIKGLALGAMLICLDYISKLTIRS